MRFGGLFPRRAAVVCRAGDGVAVPAAAPGLRLVQLVGLALRAYGHDGRRLSAGAEVEVSVRPPRWVGDTTVMSARVTSVLRPVFGVDDDVTARPHRIVRTAPSGSCGFCGLPLARYALEVEHGGGVERFCTLLCFAEDTIACWSPSPAEWVSVDDELARGTGRVGLENALLGAARRSTVETVGATP